MRKRRASSFLKIFLAILIGLVGGTVCHAEQVELRGKVIAVEEDTITIELGEPQRLAKGMQGEVYYEVLIGDTKKSIIIGQIEVTAVGESESQGRILTRSGDIRPGRLVRFNLDISPGVGVLQIFSQPSGVQVTLDDKAVGQTTAEGLILESVPSGLHIVRITRQFYRSIIQTVVIQPEETTKFSVNLERNWGDLVVTSEPSGADVQVEEQKGRTPHTFERLPAGEYEVQVQMAGYYPEKRQTVVDNEETTTLAVPLKKHAVLILEVSPKDALVSVDGSPKPPTPLRFEGISLGKHTIKVWYPDFESQTVEVTIQAGEEKHVPVTLKRAKVTLLIDSTPQGAEVVLDGEFQGKTSLQVDDVLTGDHRLRLSLDGYETVVRSLTVHESPEPIFLTLPPSIGRIRVNSVPTGASIHLEDEQLGVTLKTLELPPGEYALELRLPTYRTATKTIRLRPGTNPPVTIPLVWQHGTLRITSTPEDATITINDEQRDEHTPADGLTLPPGEYTVTIEREDYEPYTETVTLADQQVQSIDATLAFKTQLRITSNLPGIAVSLGALGVHHAPNLLRDVSPGVYEARADAKGYKSLKQRFEVIPHRDNTLAIQLSPKSRARMAVFSLILPGIGQYDGGRYVSGSLFLVTALGSAVGASIANQQYSEALEKFHRAEKQYRDTVTPSGIQNARLKMVTAHDEADRKFFFQQAALGAIGGVWALNVWHALTVGPAGVPREPGIAGKYGEFFIEFDPHFDTGDYDVFLGMGILPLPITNQSNMIGKLGISGAIGLDRRSIEAALEDPSVETIRHLAPSGQIAISAFLFNNPRQSIIPFVRGIAHIPNNVIRGKGGKIRYGVEGGLYLLHRQTVGIQLALNIMNREKSPIGIKLRLSLLP